MNSLLSKINLLQGTRSTREFSTGNTLPLVARPWGMHHWSLQTASGPWFFHPDHKKLQGVRLTHQPSPWMEDHSSLLILPFCGEWREKVEQQSSAYRLEDAVLRPNYLRVELLRYGIALEMSPSDRGAVFILTTERSEAIRLRFAFDSGHELAWNSGSRQVSGISRHYRKGATEAFDLFFTGEFDCEPVSFQKTADGGYLSFPEGVRRVEFRIAGSYINMEMARVCLRRELSGRTLNEIESNGAERWTGLLERIRIQADAAAQEATFYSCLYRCLLFPRFLDEIDETGKTLHRSPYDGQIHSGSLCTDIGFWDVYRTLLPLLNLVYPDIVRQMLEGWLNACRQAGWTPKWPSPGPCNCMIGTHFDAYIADVVAKGITDWDVEAAYKYLWKNATVESKDGRFGRDGLEEFVRLGYVAADRTRYAAASTLDYAYGDFCIAQVAAHLGREEEARELLRRSQNYRNVFDRTTGFVRGRLADGRWQEPFRPFRWGDPYIEGGPWQYAFSVPHDVPGLAELYGGNAGLCAKLDAMLATPAQFEAGAYSEEIHEMTEMAVAKFGQYSHSNQPVHNYLFLYSLAGEPAKTSYWVRRVAETLYGPDFFPGDEDNGEMAAWYVWATLGLYPSCPGKPEYVHFEPLAAKAEVAVPGWKNVLVLGPRDPWSGSSVVSHSALIG